VTAAGNAAASGWGDAWLDFLTGLSNRRHFNEMLREALVLATAETRGAFLLIDVDRFASVNETLGHSVGDALLCLAAHRLRRETRDDDLLARLGGDEFGLLIPNGEGAEALATRALGILAQPFLVEGQRVTISASIGIVRFPEHGTSTEDLMHNADLALEQAKSAGGRTWRLFDAAMAVEAHTRRELGVDLRKALTLGELSLLYRPCGDIRSHALTGFEARPRWNHLVRGMVPDSEFTQLAEASGSTVALGEWVLKTACAEAVGWPSFQRPEPLTVAVRVSPRQLQEAGQLIGTIKLALEASGLAPGRLELKIPETSLRGNKVEALSTLHRLRELGVRITLADCEIGPSLLIHVQSFPFHAIAFPTGWLPDVTADAGQTSMFCALSAAGVDQIGCYLGSSLTPASGVAGVLKLHTLPDNHAFITE
jgi:diguanylate cyclase (GGDEF)-like protein